MEKGTKACFAPLGGDAGAKLKTRSLKTGFRKLQLPDQPARGRFPKTLTFQE
jgi:hypothetical protein